MSTDAEKNESSRVPDIDAEQLMMETEYGGRNPIKWQKILIFLLAVSWSVFQLFASWLGKIDPMVLRAIHLAFAFAIAFLAYQSKNAKRDVWLFLIGLGYALYFMIGNKINLGVFQVGQYDVSINLLVIMALVIVAGLLITPRVEKKGPTGYIPWYDWAILAAGLAGALAIPIFLEQIIVYQGGVPTTRDIVLGTLTLFVLTIAGLRVVGPALMSIAWLMILYAMIGPAGIIKIELPDILYLHNGATWDNIMQQLYLTDQGFWGVPLGVSATFVYLFVLFGALLDKAGAGKYLVDLAYAGLGSYRGGPAKAAVIASMLTGIISGSSIANVVTTGTFTIPLMKRVGYPPEKAGATEVASSVNGQLMPPVMGAAAFIMADFLQMPYSKLIVYAFIPAVLTYFGLFLVVHLEAVKLGLKGLPKSELPPFKETLLSGLHYLMPIAWLLYELVVLQHTPSRSALNAMFLLMSLMFFQFALKNKGHLLIASAITFVLAIVLYLFGVPGLQGYQLELSKGVFIEFNHLDVMYTSLVVLLFGIIMVAFTGNKLGQSLGPALKNFIADVLEGLEAAGRNMSTIAVATAAAGIIVGMVAITNVGYGLTQIVETISGGNLLIALFITMLASLLLGLGLPTTANYIVMASLVAPVLRYIAESHGLDVPLVAIHLFVFYFGILADDTPPVGLAAYAAAAIARSDPVKTGFQGFGYDMRTALLPFVFIFYPQLLLLNLSSVWQGIWVVLTAFIGMTAFVIGNQGYMLTWMRGIIGWTARIAMMIGGYLLLTTPLKNDIIGAAIFVAVYLWQVWEKGRQQTAAATA
ncbi:TRAP transporter permease [Oceanithermus sp.]